MNESSGEGWDVAVIGAGPAGATAARVAALMGKHVLLVERSVIPRYKTCGGGLTGTSIEALPDDLQFSVRSAVSSFTFSYNGRLQRTRRASRPLVRLVVRDEFDASLVDAAIAAGVTVRTGTTVTGISQDANLVYLKTKDHGQILARAVIGADGSAGRSASHVGVKCGQVDVGLEVELPLPDNQSDVWTERILIDWGGLSGAYGWVFPKRDSLSIGVIAQRGEGDRTRAYLRNLLSRLNLDHLEPRVSSGHLTRCRLPNSPLYRGRVLVAGDAAGLLEPWTREGISFALRSGGMAGRAAAQAAEAISPVALAAAMQGYEAQVSSTLAPEMIAGRELMEAFSSHPWVFHLAIVLLPPAWKIFTRVVGGEISFADLYKWRLVRIFLTLLQH